MIDDGENIDEKGLKSDKEIFQNFQRTEREGIQNILKYFDRIHDKLFMFNNILIAGYFALSQFFESFSIYGIIVPLLNLGLLLIIEYRMMEKSRFESEITKKTSEEIEKNGLSINKTTRYSLYSIISTTIVVGIFIYNFFTLDSKANISTDNIEKVCSSQAFDTLANNSDNLLIIGAWTDNETENASIAFYEDSMIYVDANDLIKFDLISDTLIRYFDRIIDTSRIIKLTTDSLVIESGYGIENYIRFKD